jgi:hypothetical protein
MQKTKGTAEVRLLPDGVLETVWHGVIDGAAMTSIFAQTRDVLGADGRVRFWFSDTSRVENYAVDLHKPATDLLNFLKSRGLEETIGVVPSGMIRMLSTSLGFVVGLKIKMFATDREAKHYLEGLLGRGHS